MSESELPNGWLSVRLGDVIRGFESGRNLKSQGRPAKDGEYGVLKISAVTWGSFQPEENKALLPGDAPRPHETVRAGDVLISRANTTALVGAPVIVDSDYPDLMLPDKILRVLPAADLIDSKFLVYALRTPAVRLYFEQEATGTSDSMRNLSQPKLEGAPLCAPALAEQRRIVVKIETLTAKSRRAKEALAAIPALLERFRQSVLAAAFRGDLTADWREKNPDVEPAEELLKRIRAERRRRWEEAELAKMWTKGKVPGDDRWKERYEEPAPVDASELPELPEGWVWTSVEELAADAPRSIQSGPFGSSLLHSEFHKSGTLAIGIDNVLNGKFSVGRQNRISDSKYQELEKFTARPHDILITVMATVGRCCVVPEDIERAIITKHVYRISPDMQLIIPAYLMNSLRGATPVVRQLFGDIRGQTRPGINGAIIKRLAIPVAPHSEQHQIINMIEQFDSRIEKLDMLINEAETQRRYLDGAILAKAFRGELVPQDPDDEPASALLERIRAEATPNGKPTNGARRPRKPTPPESSKPNTTGTGKKPATSARRPR
ncbi:restriction endonuclease subunit S [Sorangium sp. So ce429]